MLKGKVLIIDDEKAICDVLKLSLEDEGYGTDIAYSAEDGLRVMDRFKPDIILLDVWLENMDGIEFLEKIKNHPDKPVVIVMSGHGNIETAVKAVKSGAWTFLEKPLSVDKIEIAIQNGMSYKKELKEKNRLISLFQDKLEFIGSSKVVQELKVQSVQLAQTQQPVFIYGSQGSGRRRVAQMVHFHSVKAPYNYVYYSLVGKPDSLQNQELFNSNGDLVIMDQGTLVLKELSYMVPGAQLKLLEWLKSGAQNIRLIVISSIVKADFPETFNKELLELLSRNTLVVPSLVERKDDIEDLIDYHLEETLRRYDLDDIKLSQNAKECLVKHDWKGNTLELVNFIERVCILSSKSEIEVADLNFAGLSLSESQSIGPWKHYSSFGNYQEAKDYFEREFLHAKVSEFGGNITKTSEAIGIERSELHKRLKNYGIPFEA